MEDLIRQELIDLSEEKYKKFTEKLIPNCANILGVRIPTIRILAKRISNGNWKNYLDKTDIYFEETMLKGLIIGNIKEDISVILKLTENFIPRITNWSLCDSFCAELKIVKKHKQEFWEFAKKYYTSSNAYGIRFAVVLFLDYYIEEKYLKDLFKIFDHIKHEDYYVKMAVAWAISMCFVKFPKETMHYYKNNKLDNFTYNKALQKTVESLKVDKDTKLILKSMKKK